MLDKDGNVTLTNVHAPAKVWGQPVPFDVHEIPSSASNELTPLETLEPSFQHLTARVRQSMEVRPISTRRALLNLMAGTEMDTIGLHSAKRIFQYCGYSFSSGPWRDAIVRYGVDPRKDPSCRVYQTMLFMLEHEPKDNRAKYMRPPTNTYTERVLDRESHIFDGKTVSKKGKVWQVCDITDPLLKNLLASSNIRKDCHVSSLLLYQRRIQIDRH